MMSFAANMVAAMTSLFRKPKPVRAVKPARITKWFRFKSENGCRWVDFCEHDSDYLEAITIGEKAIRHQGIVFVLDSEYWCDEFGYAL